MRNRAEAGNFAGGYSVLDFRPQSFLGPPKCSGLSKEFNTVIHSLWTTAMSTETREPDIYYHIILNNIT